MELNDREFRKHLQAIAHGEQVPNDEDQRLVREPLQERERRRPAQREPSGKKPPVKSKQSTPQLGKVRVRRRA